MLVALALALAPQHLPQSTFPAPPGGPTTELGSRVSISGDRALVGIRRGGQSEIWSYRRDGLQWAVEAELPPRSEFEHFRAGAFALEGDVALVGQPSVEFVFDGSQWNVAQVVDDSYFWDVDLVAGIGAGLYYGLSGGRKALFERDVNGAWHAAPSSLNLPFDSTTRTDIAVDGETAVFGDGIWFHCNHFAWDGKFVVVERNAGGNWQITADVELQGCQETLLGWNVDVDGDRIVATRRLPDRVVVFERDGAGGWTETATIAPPAGRPFAFIGATAETLDGMVVAHGNAVYAPLAGAPPTYARFDLIGGVWQVTDEWPLVGWNASAGSCGVGQARGTRGVAFWEGVDEALLGLTLPVSSGGCVTGVQNYEPAVTAATCTAHPTSTGAPATLELVGSFRRSDEATAFVATGLPAGELILPLFSATPGFAAHPGGSAGDICLGQPFTRLLHHAGAAAADGTFQFDVDFTALDLGPVAIGTPVYFQGWFRDPMNGSGAGSNFTNGTVMRMW